MKQKFMKREQQTLPPQQCMLLHEDNWDEKPPCPKQTKDIDCGLYTRSFAKQYLSDCNSPMVYGDAFQNEMVGDLLELAASNKCWGNFSWLSGDPDGKR